MTADDLAKYCKLDTETAAKFRKKYEMDFLDNISCQKAYDLMHPEADNKGFFDNLNFSTNTCGEDRIHRIGQPNFFKFSIGFIFRRKNESYLGVVVKFGSCYYIEYGPKKADRYVIKQDTFNRKDWNYVGCTNNLDKWRKEHFNGTEYVDSDTTDNDDTLANGDIIQHKNTKKIYVFNNGYRYKTPKSKYRQYSELYSKSPYVKVGYTDDIDAWMLAHYNGRKFVLDDPDQGSDRILKHGDIFEGWTEYKVIYVVVRTHGENTLVRFWKYNKSPRKGSHYGNHNYPNVDKNRFIKNVQDPHKWMQYHYDKDLGKFIL